MEDGVLTNKGLSGHLKKILVVSEIMYLKHLLRLGTRKVLNKCKTRHFTILSVLLFTVLENKNITV